jgi:hypothetical protein
MFLYLPQPILCALTRGQVDFEANCEALKSLKHQHNFDLFIDMLKIYIDAKTKFTGSLTSE